MDRKLLNRVVPAIRTCLAPVGMSTKIIAIDGPGGAGKSSIAERLSLALGGAPTIHTDDFAGWDNPLDWWPRLIEQVLEPLSANKSANYQRYDWNAKRRAEWHNVESGEHVILEGVSAARKAFRPYLAYSIWVETPKDERLRRGLARDGDAALDQWEQWMAEEVEYVRLENPAVYVDAILRGSAS